VFCSNCGAKLELPENQQRAYCSFCGTQLIIDMEEKKVKVVHEGTIRHEGKIVTEIRDKGKAEEHYKRGKELYEKAERLHFYEGYFDEAILEFRKALRLDPDLIEAHMGLGDAFSQRGLLDEAIQEYREVIRLEQYDAYAHLKLARLLLRKGTLDEAIREFREAIRVKPNDVWLRSGIALDLWEVGLDDEAVKEYKEIIRIFGKSYANIIPKDIRKKVLKG
ncbi:MAG: tetratricopeptide repeat protein, partial [Candidatus Jordarchaeaceae archaeon]